MDKIVSPALEGASEGRGVPQHNTSNTQMCACMYVSLFWRLGLCYVASLVYLDIIFTSVNLPRDLFLVGRTANACPRLTDNPSMPRVALRDEEYVRPEMLKWMAVGKEEHREKEELKKLAMKVPHGMTWFSRV